MNDTATVVMSVYLLKTNSEAFLKVLNGWIKTTTGVLVIQHTGSTEHQAVLEKINHQKALRIVAAIWNNLDGRSGFGFDDLDSDILKDIMDSLVKSTEDILNA